MRVQVLSLWEPWATLMALNLKRFETRSWPCHRTLNLPIAIHAAKKPFDPNEYERKFVEQLERDGVKLTELAYGHVVCLTTFVACHRTESVRAQLSDRERAYGNYANGRYAFEAGPVEALRRPYPLRGQQGLFPFDLPGDLVAGTWAVPADVAQGGLFA